MEQPIDLECRQRIVGCSCCSFFPERKVLAGLQDKYMKESRLQAVATDILQWCHTGPRMAFIYQGEKKTCIAYITFVQEVDENSKSFYD